MNKNYQLPQAIAAYYHASGLYDVTLLAGCFTEDAVLYDEGKEHHGPAAISEHIVKANTEAKVTMEITHCTDQNSIIIVTAMLTGEFEGSPLPLDFHFTLDSGKIKTLDITLAGDGI